MPLIDTIVNVHERYQRSAIEISFKDLLLIFIYRNVIQDLCTHKVTEKYDTTQRPNSNRRCDVQAQRFSREKDFLYVKGLLKRFEITCKVYKNCIFIHLGYIFFMESQL